MAEVPHKQWGTLLPPHVTRVVATEGSNNRTQIAVTFICDEPRRQTLTSKQRPTIEACLANETLARPCGCKDGGKRPHVEDCDKTKRGRPRISVENHQGEVTNILGNVSLIISVSLVLVLIRVIWHVLNNK